MAKKTYIEGLYAAHKAASGDSKKAIRQLIQTHVQESSAKMEAVRLKKKAYAEKQKGK